MISIGWPAFATHEAPLVARTWANLQLLEGRYGYKRYPRDGFKNAAENPTRKHYLPAEMKVQLQLQLQLHTINQTLDIRVRVRFFCV